MSNRANISLLISLMVNAVLFGTGAVLVLSIPALDVHAAILLPIVVVTSFALSPFISWYLAPRLTARWQRQHDKQRGTKMASPKGQG